MARLQLLEVTDLSSNSIAGVLPPWAGALQYGQQVRPRAADPPSPSRIPSAAGNFTFTTSSLKQLLPQ